MKLFLVYHFLSFLSILEISIQFVSSLQYAKSGCNDTCGNVTIPYPFGIGANCALNEWYVIDCHSFTTPYLSSLKNYEVLSVDLAFQTVTVKAPIISNCKNTLPTINHTVSIDLSNSPFILSKSHNRLVVDGCGIGIILDEEDVVISGCSNACIDDSSEKGKCFGIGCCQTRIPHYLKSFTMNLIELEREDGDDQDCRSVFLLDMRSHIGKSFYRRRSIDGYVPMSLMWTLSKDVIIQMQCCNDQMYFDSSVFDLGNGSSVESWKCYHWGEVEGNPYLLSGCGVTEECARCQDNGADCNYDELNIDTPYHKWNFTCSSTNKGFQYGSKSTRGLILGVSISMGVVVLVAMSYVLYKFINKMKAKRRRRRFFKLNGGLLLKQQQEADSSLLDKTILFTTRELEKATDHFNENRIIGNGGQGIVYKGMLTDGRIVAVKKSKIVNESHLHRFINEVVILSKVNHRNVVKLLGCCLETEVPLLVSEFIPNGTLYDRIHNTVNDLPISLNMRLQIATEVSGAIAYLHSATSTPIYHRDIKSTNILLDDTYRAKVSDFGSSKFVSIDQTHLTTLVKGSFGYLDPEYFQSSQFTEKSDVYSFGVVLIELLTSERPISLTRFGENKSLATHFMLAMEEGRVMSILDETVLKEGTTTDLLAITDLAMRCLNLNGKKRPTMKDVSIELETIRTSHVPSTVQTNVE